MSLHCANTTEQNEILLGGPRNIVLDDCPDFSLRFNVAFTKLLWPFVVVCAAFCKSCKIKKHFIRSGCRTEV